MLGAGKLAMEPMDSPADVHWPDAEAVAGFQHELMIGMQAKS
jgi:hypothetical protein